MVDPTTSCWGVIEEKSSKEILLVAAVALIDGDGRVLISKRPDNKVMGGMWEFPGGKVENGETPEIALVRELEEELGIDTQTSCLAPFSFASQGCDDFHLVMPLFLCRVWRGIPRPLEGQSLKWVRPSRLSEYNMPPADIHLISMLQDFL